MSRRTRIFLRQLQASDDGQSRRRKQR